jgi:hypothetical protein
MYSSCLPSHCSCVTHAASWLQGVQGEIYKGAQEAGKAALNHKQQQHSCSKNMVHKTCYSSLIYVHEQQPAMGKRAQRCAGAISAEYTPWHLWLRRKVQHCLLANHNLLAHH